MPRYFFHLRDDRYTHDEVGEDLPGPEAADREALRISGEVLRDIPACSLGPSPVGVVCTNAAGRVVAAVFVSRLSPAAGQDLLASWQRETQA